MNTTTTGDAVTGDTIQTLNDMREIIVALTDDEGRSYKGRFTGVRIAYDPDGPDAYLTEAGNVVLHDFRDGSPTVVDDIEEDLRAALCRVAFIHAMAALGIDAVVDLDV